jgi:hypothetical protein
VAGEEVLAEQRHYYEARGGEFFVYGELSPPPSASNPAHSSTGTRG